MSTTLQAARVEKGVSQKWMANQLRISRRTYHNYEHGISRIPRSVLFHAAHLLNISLEHLTDEVSA